MISLRLVPGSTLAGYLIEAELGRGGMGVVYRATQLALERTVALKLIAPELARDEGFRRRFTHEARAAASIDHPNVLPVHEAGEANGTLFVAMRYVEGPDLATVIADGPSLAPERIAALVAQVASALDAAHAEGLVHRDVKPQNVLIERRDAREHAYLCDFGLAKASLDATALTRTGTFMGTVDYVSPEQIRGELVDRRSDVYALGCLLYYGLTGRVPFQQTDELAKLWAHLHEEPTPPSACRPEISRLFDGVVARALAKDTDARYPTAGELGQAAVAAARGDGRRAVGARLPGGGFLRQRRSRGAIALAVTVAVAAVLAVLAVLQRGGAEPPDAPHRAAPAASGSVVAGRPIDVEAPPSDVVLAAGAVWVAAADANRLKRIDIRSARVLPDSGVLDYGNAALAVGGGAVWVANTQGWVGRVDATSGTVSSRRTLVDRPRDLAYGSGGVWVLTGEEAGDSTVVRIDPATQRTIAAVPGAGRSARAITTAAGAVWVLRGDSVVRIDPATDELVGAPIRVGEGARDIAAGESDVWVARDRDDVVLRIDPRLGEVVGVPIRVGHQPSALAVDESGVWVANTEDGTVSRIDPSARSVVEVVQAGPEPSSLALGGGSLWVANRRGATVTHIKVAP